ncbi:hypothetical protein HOY82DRAFT_616511 [Tuber indicum]|nr:hypothetical protein HOY82DRAFT_616511 [Tuber indicum]
MPGKVALTRAELMYPARNKSVQAHESMRPGSRRVRVVAGRRGLKYPVCNNLRSELSFQGGVSRGRVHIGVEFWDQVGEQMRVRERKLVDRIEQGEEGVTKRVQSYRKIHKLTVIPISTVNDIWIHAVTNAHKARISKEESLEEPFSMLKLISAKILNRNKRSGRPQALSTTEKDILSSLVRRDFTTRRMKLVDLQQEAGLGHVCLTTVFNALAERGLGAYQEQFKYILNPISKLKRLAYCQSRQAWLPEQEWANYAITDEMSIEDGAVVGLNHVWRNKTEQWHEDCVGAQKKQGAALMCWDIISWGWKGPFVTSLS